MTLAPPLPAGPLGSTAGLDGSTSLALLLLLLAAALLLLALPFLDFFFFLALLAPGVNAELAATSMGSPAAAAALCSRAASS